MELQDGYCKKYIDISSRHIDRPRADPLRIIDLASVLGVQEQKRELAENGQYIIKKRAFANREKQEQIVKVHRE